MSVGKPGIVTVLYKVPVSGYVEKESKDLCIVVESTGTAVPLRLWV
jgi:hypothetical protein